MASSQITPFKGETEFRPPMAPAKVQRKRKLDPLLKIAKKVQTSPAKTPPTVTSETIGSATPETLDLLKKYKACICRLDNKIAKNQATLELLQSALRDKDKAIILPPQRLRYCTKKVRRDLEKGVFKRDFLKTKIETEIGIHDVTA